MTGLISTIVLFPSQRLLFERERDANMYLDGPKKEYCFCEWIPDSFDRCTGHPEKDFELNFCKNSSLFFFARKGKTIETLAVINCNQRAQGECSGKYVVGERTFYRSKATLVIAPVSLVGQWERECVERSTVPLSLKRYYASYRKRDVELYRNQDIVFTTYGMCLHLRYHNTLDLACLCAPYKKRYPRQGEWAGRSEARAASHRLAPHHSRRIARMLSCRMMANVA